MVTSLHTDLSDVNFISKNNITQIWDVTRFLIIKIIESLGFNPRVVLKISLAKYRIIRDFVTWSLSIMSAACRGYYL